MMPPNLGRDVAAPTASNGSLPRDSANGTHGSQPLDAADPFFPEREAGVQLTRAAVLDEDIERQHRDAACAR
jgi:hypothetical protein